ncbi:MAG TPA: GntR family transcriptional regulator [Steroidobacteraceae bacterium]|nr:GntR family transcriptional regulator [Steroidobacteraceae bacterium]
MTAVARAGASLPSGESAPLVRTMSAQITARIRDKILSGAYPPGSPLRQDMIAAEHGTSKIPVREALVQLSSEGLVDIYSHRGFQVRPLSVDEAEEVFRLRLAIEPAAVARGARVASAADRAAGRSALAALSAALGAGDLRSSGDLNCAFHLALIVPRLQPVTGEILYRLHTLAQRYVRIHLVLAGRVRRANREHTALYRAWAAGSERQAQRLVRLHIEETRAELAQALADD